MKMKRRFRKRPKRNNEIIEIQFQKVLSQRLLYNCGLMREALESNSKKARVDAVNRISEIGILETVISASSCGSTKNAAKIRICELKKINM